MSTDQTRTEPHWVSNFSNAPQTVISSTSANENNNNVNQLIRFPGDGLDYRRPVMSQPTPAVIDLTEEPDSPPQPQSRLSSTTRRTASRRATRLPRFSRDVIDLEDDSEPYEADDETQTAFDLAMGDMEDLTNEPDSPEVEILFSQRASRAPSRAQGVGWHASLPRPQASGRSSTWSQAPSNMGMLDTIRSLFRMNEGEGRVRASEQRQRPGMSPAPVRIRRPSPHPLSAGLRMQQMMINEGLPIDDISENFRIPEMLDFETAAFHVHRDVTAPPPLPLYNVPTPPRAGYTRSAGESDVIICPNCNSELGIGDDETKRSVWVIKKCGHVSLGELK